VSDYESIQKRRDIIVGLFVILAMCALFWMVFKFGDLPVFVSERRSFEVLIQFPEATGVQESTPVRFCGYQIGMVTKIKPPKVLKDLNTGRFYHQTLVVLSIDKKYDNIPYNVQVKLMTRGLGSSYIDLKEPPFDVQEMEQKFLTNGSLLQGSTGMTSEFFPEESQKKLDELADGLKALLKNANDILGDETNKENIRTTLANLSKATEQAKDTLKKLEDFSAAGVTTSEELTRTVTELRLVLEKINSGSGSAAKFVNDGRLYENLLENTRQLDVLLKQLASFIEKAEKKGIKMKL
jgi:phospholipid/cholesterol/gamma-HCH transport system substrate-binding protein